MFRSGPLATAIFFGYTFAFLFAAFAVAYRYSVWLQRSLTRLYWRRGWQAFPKPVHLRANVEHLAGRFVGLFALNVHIPRRSKPRWVAHLLIMWGYLMAGGITFTPVYGWSHFETVPGHLTTCRVFAFGVPAFDVAHDSLAGHLMFHGLVWSASLVVPDVLMAFRRRLAPDAARLWQAVRAPGPDGRRVPCPVGRRGGGDWDR